MTEKHTHFSAESKSVTWQARPPHSDWRLIAPEHLDDYRAKDWEVRPMPTDAQSVGMREALEAVQSEIVLTGHLAEIVDAALAAQPPAAPVETPITTEQLDKLQFGKVLHSRSSAASEPVAWTNEAQLGFLKDPELVAIPMAMWGKPNGAARIPLYTAQPQAALMQKIEAEARRYAEMYPQSSDGRNTFVIFADWVASQGGGK